MRPRDRRVLLHDMLRAADAIIEFTEDRSFSQYCEDLMLRSAVERQFEILGEAMSRALRAEPDIERELVGARTVVDFRNVIAHGYDLLSDRTVWDVATTHLPALRDRVAGLLSTAERW
ncbi:MAG: DUF86 domain-containing protein [Anaerosomatales bacterium]|nr:DUF86 domain-containing protein [Coriobacteriia bacterium]